MRKWHRWLSVFFGVVLMFVTITGLLHYAVVWWPAAEAGPPPAPPAGFECPEGWRCIAPAAEGSPRSMLGLIHHLHSGEELGFVGEIIVMLSGLALAFFTISGLWMYYQMWRNRTQRGLKGGVFWS